MDAPTQPGGGAQAGIVLTGALVVVVLVVLAGFLFDLPFGFGGWQLAIVAAPVTLAILALAAVLRTSRHR